MRANWSGKSGLGELNVEGTGRPVRGGGGPVGVTRFLDRPGIRSFLRSALPDGRRSPNQVPVEDIASSLLATVLTGGSRFSHGERIWQDEVIRGVVGVKRLAPALTRTRFVGGPLQNQVEHMSDVLNPLFRSTLKELPGGEVIDLDSTVFERYGRKKGSLKRKR